MKSCKTDLEVIARTVFGECRGETDFGKLAVASVIKNRSDNPRWWGSDFRSVCLAPFQFSVWRRKDANYITARDTPLHDSRMLEIMRLCSQVICSTVPDPTNNCDHYCRTDVAWRTHWAKDQTPVVIIGNHSFYRLELQPHAPDRDLFGTEDSPPDTSAD